MYNFFVNKISGLVTNWLLKDKPKQDVPLCDFERIRYELRPCDVILIEGRSRVSEIIKLITQSSWSHSALYIGRVHDIEDPKLQQQLRDKMQCDESEQLVVEGMLGKGTIATPLTNYKIDHIRICRPQGISRQDAQQVINFAISHLGVKYSIRHTLDLARFLFPWSIVPRCWRSYLFQRHVGESTHEICSSMIAEAFDSVHFPVLPIHSVNDKKKIQFKTRNPRLYTPRDFDYSPYFEIIKYPIFELAKGGLYRHLPWDKEHPDLAQEVIKAAEAQHQSENNDVTNPVIETNNKSEQADEINNKQTEKSADIINESQSKNTAIDKDEDENKNTKE